MLKEAIDDFTAAALREERQKRSQKGTGISEFSSGKAGFGNVRELPDHENPELISTDGLTLDVWEDLKLIMCILELFRRWTLLLQGTRTGRTQAN